MVEHSLRFESTPESAPEPAAWWRDVIVWLGAVVGASSTAWVVFADRYLPYIDWAAHLGLISVLANGDQTGALAYYERSFGPSPYLLFYATTALFAQIVPTDLAAKIVLVLTGGLLCLSAAALASASGRSPRLSLIAPLALFGLSLGWGFGSFVVATPFLFFTLASTERLLRGGAGAKLSLSLWLSLSLSLLFVAHGFLFVVGVVLALLRVVFHALIRHRSLLGHPVRGFAIALCAPVLLATPAVLTLLETPTIEAGTRADAPLFEFLPLAQHVDGLTQDLLDRGSPGHEHVMGVALLLLAVWFVIGWKHPRPPEEPKLFGLEFYAGAFVLLFAFGPMTVNWPSSIWLVYPRFGVIAALAVFLLPRADLSGWKGASVALVACGLVVWNGELNAAHVRSFSALAHRYDAVRKAIPPCSRVIAITVPGREDFVHQHHALGGLYSYHMVDGASYVAFLFDKKELPVHRRSDIAPGVAPDAPHWGSPESFDPMVHGRDYDYVVLRGEGIILRTARAGQHDLVANFDGWAVFKTRAPTPRPDANSERLER